MASRLRSKVAMFGTTVSRSPENMAIKTRLTLDDLIPSKRNEGHYMIDQDKKTGKPKVRKKKQKKVPKPYCKQYPMFFRLMSDNPSIPDPVEEFKFHPTRKWRIDICWPELKLALEIEGGVYMTKKNGNATGHRSITNFISDIEKYNALSIHGFSLLRFTPQQMDSCEAYDYLREWFKNNVDKTIGSDRNPPEG